MNKDYTQRISLYDLSPRNQDSMYLGIFSKGTCIGDIGAYKISDKTLQLYTSLNVYDQHLEQSLRMLEKELSQNIEFERVQLTTSNL